MLRLKEANRSGNQRLSKKLSRRLFSEKNLHGSSSGFTHESSSESSENEMEEKPDFDNLNCNSALSDKRGPSSKLELIPEREARTSPAACDMSQVTTAPTPKQNIEQKPKLIPRASLTPIISVNSAVSDLTVY